MHSCFNYYEVNKMNLYLIKRDDPRDEIDWDQFRGHVIAATDESDARRIARNKEIGGLDESIGQIWMTRVDSGLAWPYGSTVTLLASDVDLQEGIVLSDYLAG
tara:strand:+ start:2344 stop:2652 length:309 start_codon:yes stop_codon:yes gene_type:complete